MDLNLYKKTKKSLVHLILPNPSHHSIQPYSSTFRTTLPPPASASSRACSSLAGATSISSRPRLCSLPADATSISSRACSSPMQPCSHHLCSPSSQYLPVASNCARSAPSSRSRLLLALPSAFAASSAAYHPSLK